MTARRPPMLVLGFLLLAGCQEDAAPRPIHIDKGVYQGTPDTPRSDAEVRALQQRTATQRF